jgi:hypothetical protein
MVETGAFIDQYLEDPTTSASIWQPSEVLITTKTTRIPLRYLPQEQLQPKARKKRSQDRIKDLKEE